MGCNSLKEGVRTIEGSLGGGRPMENVQKVVCFNQQSWSSLESPCRVWCVKFCLLRRMIEVYVDVYVYVMVATNIHGCSHELAASFRALTLGEGLDPFQNEGGFYWILIHPESPILLIKEYTLNDIRDPYMI